MKDILTYISEAKENVTYDNVVDAEAKRLCEQMVKGVDFSKLKITNEQDPNRFEISRENERMFIDNLKDENYRAITSEEFCEMKGKKWSNLSEKEKSMFDTQNGDIIILDKDDKPTYYVDIKISDNYLGAVSLGSIANFNDDGVYLCVSKKKKTYNIVSHKSLVEAVKRYTALIRKPTYDKEYTGYKLKWEGQDFTSEYFVKGLDIEKFK